MKTYQHCVNTRRRDIVPPTLPKEVEPIGPRAYRDWRGTEYSVWWNGHHQDPSLSSPYLRGSSMTGLLTKAIG